MSIIHPTARYVSSVGSHASGAPAGETAVLSYVRAEFSFENRPAVSVLIGVVAPRQEDAWQIRSLPSAATTEGVVSKPA